MSSFHKAKVRLLDPEGFDAEGRLFVPPDLLEWAEVDYLEPHECEHIETMCRACRPYWANDWEIVVDLQ